MILIGKPVPTFPGSCRDFAATVEGPARFIKAQNRMWLCDFLALFRVWCLRLKAA
jgi:hypothetical protein